MFQKHRLRRIALEGAILKGTITRSEIAGTADIRLATVIEAVRSLVNDGILVEPERIDGKGTGRRASPLAIHADLGAYWGIALSPEQLRMVIIDASGEIIASRCSDGIPPEGPDAIFQEIEKATAVLKAQNHTSRQLPFLGVGFADPGLADETHGRSIKAVNLPAWENIATAERLQRILACPVWVYPEMSARAYAERLLEGTGQQRGCFHLSVDRGVGGAYSRGLEIYAGDSSCHMEIGHIVVVEDGALCQCGNRGCLEAYAGREGMARRVAQLSQEGVNSLLVGTPYSPDFFVSCVQQGDKAALRLALETGQYLGKALASAASLLNPSLISLSGPLFQLEEHLLPALKQSLTLRCLPQALQGLGWRLSSLGPETSAHGAALLARHRHLTSL